MKKIFFVSFLSLFSVLTHAQEVTPLCSPTPSESTQSRNLRDATPEEKSVILQKLGENTLNEIANQAAAERENKLSSLLNPTLKQGLTKRRDLTLTQVRVPVGFDLNVTEKDGKPLFHEIYIGWGYHRGFHSKSDVMFKTSDGTFTVHDTKGYDRPSPFSPKVYFNPAKFSIPQYNLEIGVMFNSKWGLELKSDHMKWVFDNERPYEIAGNYNHDVMVANPNPVAEWDAVHGVPFSVAAQNKDATWLKMEHTDGYNYASLGAVYNQNLLKSKDERFKLDARFGAGLGLIIPKTKVMFHQDERWNWEGLDNKFHIAGGGAHAEAKLRVTLFTRFYVQAAARGTVIKVKDALVDGTDSRMEHIQPITSIQFMGQVGYTHPIGKMRAKKRTSGLN
jgi:hypothetical protein